MCEHRQQGLLAARSRRFAALPRFLLQAGPRGRGATAASPSGRQAAQRLDMAAALEWAVGFPLGWRERRATAAEPDGRDIAARARALGRRPAGAQGYPDELPYRRRRRRCAAGRQRRGARGRSVHGDPSSTACCRPCSTCRRRATTITGCCATLSGQKLSKSRESKTLRELRAEGVTPLEARALAGRATL